MSWAVDDDMAVDLTVTDMTQRDLVEIAGERGKENPGECDKTVYQLLG